MTYFEVISLIANVCTIIASYIAFHVWRSWKKQQNYSFKRDKIFEVEFAISKMYSTLETYYEQYKIIKAAYIANNSIPLDPRYVHQQLKELDIEFEKNLSRYTEAVYSLEILEIETPENFFINREKILEDRDRLERKLSNIWDISELYNHIESEILRLKANKKRVLGFLKAKRKSI
ncbi:hypothetical protein HCY58_15200 [Acinetobacter radioresistens]|uniref:hypothetical protein n=1 Tax=Acinetobacter radioresistens TaxID=40216 RepID=UPI0020052F80|nr:hypothetical protein [Acinetobacter radioresistens]MCK4088384.1 hypothetical protein [Acinetobacter radioresistens]